MTTPFNYIFGFRATPLKFGVGATELLGKEAKKLGVKNALIIADNLVYEKTDVIKRAIESLEKEEIKYDIWKELKGEPTEEDVDKALDYVKGKDFDGFIGIGGGSAIDLTKIVDACYTHKPQSFKDYLAKPYGKGEPIPGPIKPLIAIPTTSGTGSETTRAAVIIVENAKATAYDDFIAPKLAIVDPLNTITMSPKVTAGTGIDAFTHALEAYLAKPTHLIPPGSIVTGSNLLVDIVSEKAIELIGKSLRVATWDGKNLDARSDMALAAYLAGIAFDSAGLHVIHSIGQAIGAIKGISHGISVGLFAPAFLEVVAPICPEKVAKVAELLGKRTRGLDKIEAAMLASEAVRELLRDIGFPNGLSEFDIKENDISKFVEESVRRPRINSPIAITPELAKNIITKSIKIW
ncbi:MAG: iron-containing alcohol dehydrogenase [Synergistetes bacterium]|nr:iron-containing alcohol dehydrogenase [Synergistota bacterium]MCX8127746.1 iron-containing alcohol dehydrogenase [Synergistota bacterium]MDW8191339.1 iron-containing alcohol dehydrogenase [Synergistota bacterium]